MSRFFMENAEINYRDIDGEMSPDEVNALCMIEIRDIFYKLEESIGTIAHAISKGEIQVHRTN